MRNHCYHISILLATLAKFECVVAAEGINTKTSMILFPWFCQVAGIVVYFLLSRVCHWFPYTAALFLVGVIIGISSRDPSEDGNYDSLFEASVHQWMNIDGDLVLLVFLPGLLFLDAFNVNYHLFVKGFFQLVLLAFPGVLAGTVITAQIAKQFMGWGFNLAMAFGSILSATDPVAVSALLNECGAPPRLKMHVSGESLLNDGAAIVFFTIFRKLYYNEIGVSGGEEIDTAKGFEMFFKMSLGGVAFGFLLGFSLIQLLKFLNRRLESEENIVQVSATLTIAYLSFYVSEACFHMSGVISVVICGITLKAYGEGVINDDHLMQNFFSLVEHLLNTILFTLAGTLWGDLVRTRSQFSVDLKNFVVLYLAVIAIRFFLVFALHPINSRIGLGSNWKEAFFLSWGGLRGAVGIALAINLMKDVDPTKKNLYEDVQDLFIIVGGITFLTLVVNGPTSAPVLKKLRLGYPTNSRKKLIQVAEESMKRKVVDDFVRLLTFKIFAAVNFSIVKKRVPMIADLTVSELKEAVRENKKNVPELAYKRPYLRGILPYLMNTNEDEENTEDLEFLNWREEEASFTRDEGDVDAHITTELSGSGLGLRSSMISKLPSEMDIQEHRLIFLELLRSNYHNQIERGHLDPRQGELGVYLLFTSLEFAGEDIRRGEPLDDWKSMKTLKKSFIVSGWKYYFHGSCTRGIENPIKICKGGNKSLSDLTRKQLEIRTILAFLDAHMSAQEKFNAFFKDCVDELKLSKTFVLKESKLCVEKAQQKLHTFKKEDINQTVTIHFCEIILNKSARYVHLLQRTGVLSEKEARHMTEHIQKLLITNRTNQEDYSKELALGLTVGRGGRFTCDFSQDSMIKIESQVAEPIINSDP